MSIILDTVMEILASGAPGVVVDKTASRTGGMVARHFSEKTLQGKVESQLDKYYQGVQNSMNLDDEFDNRGLLNGSKELISSAKACSVGPEREMRRRQYFALGYSLAGLDSKQKNQTLDAILSSVLNFVQEESGDAITIKAVDELHEHMNLLATKDDIKGLRDQINTSPQSNTVDFSDFYEYVLDEFIEEKDNSSVELLGGESDDKAYIEQFITTQHGRKSVLPFLSDWFEGKKYGTILISGEPGHGKSLLCKKAVVGESSEVPSTITIRIFRICWSLMRTGR